MVIVIADRYFLSKITVVKAHSIMLGGSSMKRWRKSVRKRCFKSLLNLTGGSVIDLASGRMMQSAF